MRTRGIVSGYWNPLHGGHLDYFYGAKQQCDWLIAIVNNDHQVGIKGSIPFMDEEHRRRIVGSLKMVDDTIIAIDADSSVAKTLEFIRQRYPGDELIFFNGGDRQKGNLNPLESAMCAKCGIKEVVLDQPKRYSSSVLLSSKTMYAKDTDNGSDRKRS